MEKSRLSDSDLHSPPDFPFSCRVCSFSVPLDHPVRVYSEHGSWTASTKRPETPRTSPCRLAISSSVRIFFSIVSLLFYSVFLTPSESFADPFRDFILYSYQTPEQGEVSVGTWQTLLLPNKTTDTLYGKNIRNANLLFSTYVLEFGVTDWWTMGAYIDFSAGAEQTYSYLQTRAITTRLRFPKIPDFVDPAVQIEYWVPGGGTGMQSFLDIILIAEKKIGPFLFDINPKFLFPTDGSQPNYPPVFLMQLVPTISWRRMSTPGSNSLGILVRSITWGRWEVLPVSIMPCNSNLSSRAGILPLENISTGTSGSERV